MSQHRYRNAFAHLLAKFMPIQFCSYLNILEKSYIFCVYIVFLNY